MGVKVYIDSTFVFEETFRGGGKSYRQEARMPVPGKPTEHFLIRLDSDKNGNRLQEPYPVGVYEFSPESFRRGQYGDPEFGFRAVLQAVAAEAKSGVAQLVDPKAKATA